MEDVVSIIVNKIAGDMEEVQNGNSTTFVSDEVELKSVDYSKNYETELYFGKDESEEICADIITVKKMNDEALVSKRLSIPKSHQKCHKTHQCEFCFKNFISENTLRIHKENHCKNASKKSDSANKFYRSDINIWKCKKCQEIFSCIRNAKNHQLFCHSIANNEEDIELVSTEMLLQCEFCNRTFIDKSFLLKHQHSHTTLKNFQCVNCNKVFDSYSLAAFHWIKPCSEFSNAFYLPTFTYCEYCENTFKNHELLYNHKIKNRHYTQKLHVMANRHQFEQNQVTEDNNKEKMNQLIQDILETLQVPKDNDHNRDDNIAAHFMKKAPPQSLLKISSDKKPKYQKNSPKLGKYLIATQEGFKWQCENCIKVFDVIDGLEAHRQEQHQYIFTCSTCPEEFKSARALLAHTRYHKNLKPYVCETCGHNFSQASHLEVHMRFHQGIKPFGCPHEGCEARYTLRRDLKDHICTVHTRERPFKCNLCDKSFLTASVYYKHRLIHTNDRRHGCDKCGKKFLRNDCLTSHKLVHTNERPHQCTICGTYFRRAGDRNKHIRMVHNEHN